MTGLFVVKIAFLYLSTNRNMVGNRAVVPTYRISVQVYPVVKFPHVSAALSEINHVGEASPLFIVKSSDGEELSVKALPSKPR